MANDVTNTRLFGYQGGDVLIGGGGDDYIVGGAGKDLMRGGGGADKFVFQRISDSDLETRDIIYDFQVGLDKLVFTGLAKGEASLVVEDVFTGFGGLGHTEVHFVDGTDQLLMDLDGNGTMDMRMALIGVGNTLSLGDFIWEAPPPP